MKNITIFIFLTLAIQITSCQNIKHNKISISEKLEEIDFLNLLPEVCWEGREGVLKNCDELFTKKGHLYFILIPKIGTLNWYKLQMTKNKGTDKWDKEDKILDEINKKEISDLDKKFNIWVFFTDIKYLKGTPKMDSPYNPKIPRKEVVYFLQDDIKKWKAIDSLVIENEKDEEKKNKWRENFIEKIVKKSNENKTAQINQSLNKVFPQWYGNYILEIDGEKLSDETMSNRSWLFIINQDKALLKINSYHEPVFCEGDYNIVEKNNQLELFYRGVSGDGCTHDSANFIIKKENNDFYIKSDDFNRGNKWLLLKKTKQTSLN